VEGGSANDYDYVSGDPVNGFDLNGTKRTCAQATAGFSFTELCENVVRDGRLVEEDIAYTITGFYESGSKVCVGLYEHNVSNGRAKLKTVIDPKRVCENHPIATY